VLSFVGFGDVCNPSDPDYDQDACNAETTSGSTTASVQIPGPSLTASGATPQFNYASWPCSNCYTASAGDQQTLCQAQCGNTVAMAQAGGSASQTLTAQAVTGLPSGSQASALPNLPGTPTSVAGATNWWGLGIAAAIGLGLAFVAYRLTTHHPVAG
jgi:hypothetical protein